MAPIAPKENNTLNRTLVVIAVFLAAFLTTQSWKTILEGRQIGFAPRTPNTFTINGEGKVSGQPTLAQVSLGLYSEGMDVPKVQDTNATKVNGIIAAMRTMGIAEADLQTSNYSIQPKYQYTDGNQTIVGYSVSQSFNIKVRDLTKVGTVISKAGELGANQVNGVTFTIDDPTGLELQARTKAIENARSKANELAKAMGVDIVNIVTFSESSNTPNQPIFAYRDMATAEPMAKTAPDIQPGSLDVSSNVSVTFEIR